MGHRVRARGDAGTSAPFDQWLKDNPAPDLQALAARYGGCDKITPEAWAEYDRAVAEWQLRRRKRQRPNLLPPHPARRPGATPRRAAAPHRAKLERPCHLDR